MMIYIAESKFCRNTHTIGNVMNVPRTHYTVLELT